MKISKKTFVKVLLALIVLALLGLGGYYFYQYQQVIKNPQIINQKEVDWLVSKVSQHYSLPQDETPSSATVLDADKLKDQLFFKNAQNGDKILLYMEAKKAILYRPSEDRVIEIMPLVLNDDGQSKVNTDQEGVSQDIKVTLYNGSDNPNALSSAWEEISDQINNVKLTSEESANNDNYTNTIVIDLTGEKQTEAESIAKAVGGKVEDLPEGETKPDADILVIVAE